MVFMVKPLQLRNNALPPSSSSWDFYLSPGETWKAMYRDCEHARVSIELEQYILQNDAAGQRFMKLFIRKAREGVKVVLILDRFGSQNLATSPLLQEFKEQGGYFHFYRPLGWRKLFLPKRWFPRTHVKTLLIDSTIAYTGGACIDEKMHGWRDTQMRFTGPAVQEVRKAFDMLEKRFWKNLVIPAPSLPRSSPVGLHYVAHHPQLMQYPIYEIMMTALSRAEKSIRITMAYFIPNLRFRNMLKHAAMRGVKVQIIVPEHSDRRLADWVRLSYAGDLLKAGIEIFHYQPTVLHCKTMIIDDSWATIGSANMDIISFFHNREANVVMKDSQTIAELAEHFLEDLSYCMPLTQKRLQHYPKWKLFVGTAARSLKIFLHNQPKRHAL